jgi:dephospho-CoA kinase
MEPGKSAWRKIVARFGDGILGPGRTIDRKALGRIVFSDGEARAFLDALIHPLVLADQARLVRRLEREGRTKIFVSEAALTVEAGAARRFDKVVVVHCRPDVQVRRLMARDAIGGRAARQRIRSQMPQKEKLRHADYAVDASGIVEETVEQTERLFAALVRDYEDLGRKRRRTGD